MTTFFTICSNNYLAQASVLCRSLKEHNNNIDFFTILVDEYADLIDYSQLPFTCIAIREIEPEIDALIEKYDIVELNTCIKPAVFQYLFDNYPANKVIYLDPDIKVYDSLDSFNLLFKTHNILLTPHIYSPIEIDGKTPDENHFLNHGTFNLGFIAIQRSEESIRFIKWWKNRTYLNGYSRVSAGIFVDQLYINLVPVFFKGVCVIDDTGLNMAAWNLHERYLSKTNEIYWVNNKHTLKFFHFSSFILNSFELPVHYYNRFKMADREDLRELFVDYNNELLANGYLTFKPVKCVYFEYYNTKKLKAEQDRWDKKSSLNKLLIKIINKLPPSQLNKIKKAVKNFL